MNKLYAYAEKEYPSLLKVGDTTKEFVRDRIYEQVKTSLHGEFDDKYEIVLGEDEIISLQYPNGKEFRDKAVHKVLEASNIYRCVSETGGTEWFECSAEDVIKAVEAVKAGKRTILEANQNYEMRPSQKDAVEKTSTYLTKFHKDYPDLPGKYLWNCKMRFGKTFTSYQLAKKMGWEKVLVITYKPAVKNSWATDLATHVDFKDWQFYTVDDEKDELSIPEGKVVAFYSFQYLLRNEKKDLPVKKVNWDCIILDEYHYGAWRNNAKKMLNSLSKEEKVIVQQCMSEEKEIDDEEGNVDTSKSVSDFINADNFLYLSGTPFRALKTGEFQPEQIFSWTYTDEQQAKDEWVPEEHEGKENPYKDMPEIRLLAYKMGSNVLEIAQNTEKNQFDLSSFFKTKKIGKEYKFENEDKVARWLRSLDGSNLSLEEEEYRSNHPEDYPKLPFEDGNDDLRHTLWFLPDVASCKAMYSLLTKSPRWNAYKVICCAGDVVGVGEKALMPVKSAITQNGKVTRTITLSCGKLTTGVTVKEWNAIFMLRNCSSPETYFQAAFRVQSPWKENHKQICYIYDFAPDRAIRQIVDNSYNQTGDSKKSPVEKITDYTKFLQVLAYEDGALKSLSATDIFNQIAKVYSSTDLLDKWHNPYLIYTDFYKLEEITKQKELLQKFDSIIVSGDKKKDPFSKRADAVINGAGLGKPGTIENPNFEDDEDDENSPEDECDDTSSEEGTVKPESEDKVIKALREKIKYVSDHLRTFMYLTDFREKKLDDIMNTEEKELFEMCTKLSVQDFEKLRDMGIFNSQELDTCIYSFKQFEEDAKSFNYTGKDTLQDRSDK